MGGGKLVWLRRLLWLHRVLGWGLCVLFVVWFASGIVMLFHGYPSYGEAERLADAPLMAPDVPLKSAAQLRRKGIALPTSMRLRRLGETYAYLFEDAEGKAVAVDAQNGRPLAASSCDEARAAARSTGFPIGGPGERLGKPDQWTLSSRLAPQFPLCRWELDDGNGTIAYTSMRTSELVHRTTRVERMFAWLGAIPHWIYPSALRRQREIWRWLVVGLAAASTLVSLFGLVAGIWLAWRFQRRTGRWVPYVRNMPRWHHRLGLVFGLFACTWVLSGALSLDPLGMSAEAATMDALHDRLRGDRSQPTRQVTPQAALKRCAAVLEVRELRFLRVLGVPYYLCARDAEHTRLLRADVPHAPLCAALDRDTWARAARRLRPAARMVSLRRLSHGDSYVYANHFRPRRGRGVVRARYGDDVRVYLDPRKATLVGYFDASARWHRWLYHGLHSWDVRWLLARDELRLALMLAGLLGGLGTSATALVVGVRRLRRRA